MTIKHLSLWPLLAAAFLIAACVDEDYDMNKLDADLDISFDITAPIGSAEFVKLSDFLTLDTDSENSVLVKDEAGNYLISFTSSTPISADVEIPSVEFDLNSMTAIGVDVNLNDQLSSLQNTEITEEAIAAMKYQYGDDSVIQTSDLPDDASSQITINYDLPEGLVDLQELALSDGEVSIHISTETHLSLAAGFTLTFPDFICLKAHEGANYTLDDAGHVITINEDAPINSTESFDLSFYITKLDLTKLTDPIVENVDGSLSLQVDDPEVAVVATGQVIVNLEDFIGSTLPSQVSFEISLSTTTFKAEYVIAKIDFSYDVDTMTINISDIPEDLSSENIVLDIYNPVILISAYNGSPLSLVMDADFEASLNGESTMTSPVHIGANSTEPTDKVRVEANQENNIYISRREYSDMVDGGVNVIATRIGELLKTIPDTIVIDNVTVTTDTEDWVTIYPEDCSCEISYAIEAPIAFGDELSLEYEVPISGLAGTFDGINQDVDPENGLYLTILQITGEIVSTIPASFAIEGEPIDADGNVLSGIELEIDGAIKGGSIENPVTSALEITLEIKNSDIAVFDGLNLILTGTSYEDIIGVCLNENQGLKINNLSARVVGSYVLSF